MLQWLFGKSNQATRGEDCVWMSSAARLRGMAREVAQFVGEGRSVIVVALTPAAFDDLVRELALHKPCSAGTCLVSTSCGAT